MAWWRRARRRTARRQGFDDLSLGFGDLLAAAELAHVGGLCTASVG
ncbi:hypothetical protein [Actinacidiphila soli]|nr:hypothetical protein [Actinacidiphila soli]